ncbi:MAG: hypothetical protein ACI37T_02340 [Candidatus Gastranaerophilaceae bacterium]
MSDENFQPEVESQEKEEPAAQENVSSNEIAKLHRECAKYRNALKTSNEEKADVQKQFDEIKTELDSVCKQKIQQDILFKLEKFGCLKPSLVLKDMLEECDNIDEFLASYRVENPFLFESPKVKHGYSFRGGRAVNYTPSQQMNNYIRSALGR